MSLALEKVCFCCLREGEILHDLLENRPETLLPLVECYTACTGVDPKVAGPLVRICSACEENLKSFFEFREMCRASYKLLTENGDSMIVVQREDPTVNETRRSRRKATSIQEFVKVPSDVDASDLEADFLCLHCDIYLPNHREYKVHYEQHRAGHGYKRIHRICEICQIETTTFVSHMLEKHRDFKPFKCKFCAKVYRTSRELRIHLDSHTTINRVKCMACQEFFNRPCSLRVHILNHENLKNEYFCPACGQTFQQFRVLQTHFEADHEKSTPLFPCVRCKKVYMSRKACINHSCSAELEAERPPSTIECAICLDKFLSEDDLFCHQITCRYSDDLHSCNICNKTFDTRPKLQKHIRFVHVGRIARVCEVCGHGSKSNTAYEQHMASHAAESSFKCPRADCNSAFKHQNLLKNHMRQHEIKDGLRPKPFECHHCKKTFAQLVGIKRHMGTHFDTPLLRPYKCLMCEKRLQTKNDFEVHLVTHSRVNTRELNRIK